MKLEIEFDLRSDKVFLTTPFSRAEFSDTETGRAMLFRALRNCAMYEAGRQRKLDMGETPAGRDVSDAILAYDAKQIKKFDERNRPVLNLEDLEVEF